MKSSLLILLPLCALAQSNIFNLSGPSRNPCTKSNEKMHCPELEECVNGICEFIKGPLPFCTSINQHIVCLEDEDCIDGKCVPVNRRGTCTPDKSKPHTQDFGFPCCDGLAVNPTTGLCYKPCTRNSDCVYTKFYNKIHGECVNKACQRPKRCGDCGNVPVDGHCCDGKRPERITGYCSCDCKTDYDCPGYTFCENKQCIVIFKGKTCGGCGKMPIDGKCCKFPKQVLRDGEPCACDEGRGKKCKEHGDCGVRGQCVAGSCTDNNFVG